MAGEELKSTDYPDYEERVSCKAMPQVKDGYLEVEVDSLHEEPSLVEVPQAAVRILGMPRLSEGAPDLIRKIFQQGAGLGMLACHVVERNEDEQFAVVDIPTKPEPTTITIPLACIVRRR
jgi:hypothetical protein